MGFSVGDRHNPRTLAAAVAGIGFDAANVDPRTHALPTIVQAVPAAHVATGHVLPVVDLAHQASRQIAHFHDDGRRPRQLEQII